MRIVRAGCGHHRQMSIQPVVETFPRSSNGCKFWMLLQTSFRSLDLKHIGCQHCETRPAFRKAAFTVTLLTRRILLTKVIERGNVWSALLIMQSNSPLIDGTRSPDCDI